MNKNFIKAILPILFSACCSLSTRGAIYPLEHLGVSDGLSHYGINEFYEDEFGRMWVATRNGLNCVCGTDCRTIGINDSTGWLSTSYVRHICGNHAGSILIQSGSSAVLMDLQTEQTEMIEPDNVQNIAWGTDRYLYAIRSDVYAYAKGKKQKIFSAGQRILSLLEDEGGLWVATEDEVLRLTTRGNIRHTDTIAVPRVAYIYNDPAGNRVWFCSRSEGLLTYDTCICAHYLQHQDVRTVVRTASGEIWAGTWSGLVKIDEQSGCEIPLPFRHVSDAHPFSVWALASDRQGTLWIGSFFGAVDMYNPHRDIFRFWTEGPSPWGLTHPIVSCVCRDGQTLWVGTNGGGVCKIQLSTGTVTSVAIDSHIPQCAVKAMWLDTLRQTLWIGTHGQGLLALNTTTGEKTYYSSRSGYIANDRVRNLAVLNDTLFFSSEKEIGWVALASRTLGKPEGVEVTGELADLYPEKDNLWFARQKNVYCYHLPTRSLRTYRTDYRVQCFATDADGSLLAGTTNGVYRLTDGQFLPDSLLGALFGRRLCNNLLADSAFYIVGGIGDITLVDKRDQTGRVLSYSEGFPIDNLMEKSCRLMSDGTLYVGGVNGLCAFEVQLLLSRKEPCTILPSCISIRQISGETKTLSAGLPYLRTLQLTPRDRELRIRIATNTHCAVFHPNLQYRLTGYEKEWQTLGANPEVVYANLSPGKYLFEIRDDCTDSWSVQVTVEAPWYRTWWAWLLYAAIILIVIVGVAVQTHQRATDKASAQINEQKRILDEQSEQIIRMKEHLENEKISFSTRARAIIMKNLSNPDLDVNLLAGEMCVSRSGLYTKLQDAIGQTPNELIMSIRLEEAAKLIRETPYRSITEISEMVGFSSTSYFIKCFSKQFNQTPSQYRK